jgi:hypothetical protein
MLPGIDVPGYRSFRPCGTAAIGMPLSLGINAWAFQQTPPTLDGLVGAGIVCLHVSNAGWRLNGLQPIRDLRGMGTLSFCLPPKSVL